VRDPAAKPGEGLSTRTHAVIVVVLLLVIGGVVWIAGLQSPGEANPSKRENAGTSLRAPASTQLPDSAPVIGVSVGGRHRAYVIQALLRPDAHVYNDLLGEVPVTVTYCDLDECVRVLTAPDSKRPLDIRSGGSDRSRSRKMLLQIGSTRYWQDTGKALEDEAAPFPFTDAAFTRTTWRQWHDAHPDTDVYVGDLPFKPADPATPLATRPVKN
jgi:Protein of unknown function (DUF3179)